MEYGDEVLEILKTKNTELYNKLNGLIKQIKRGQKRDTNLILIASFVFVASVFFVIYKEGQGIELFDSGYLISIFSIAIILSLRSPYKFVKWDDNDTLLINKELKDSDYILDDFYHKEQNSKLPFVIQLRSVYKELNTFEDDNIEKEEL